jgi:hypothetical protein
VPQPSAQLAMLVYSALLFFSPPACAPIRSTFGVPK